MTALHYRSLATTAADIRCGAISSEEVTRHVLSRIAELEPRLHAFAEVRADAALDEAKHADACRLRGEPLGTLHGVPIAVKDLCAMAGTCTRAGGFFPTRFAPTDTATVVSRLQGAGAIVIGKAQLTEGAFGPHHPDIAPPVNPWAPDRWAGESSSGSGVSVAAGLSYAALGTDTGGSIRHPSACNHLVGLKPTWGRVSRHGVFGLSATMDHVGPMARTVLDVAILFDVIGGADARDVTTLVEPMPNCTSAAQKGTLKGRRIAIDPNYTLANLDESTSTALNAAMADMKAAGAVFVEVRLPDVRPMLERMISAVFVDAAITHAPTYPSHKSSYSPAAARFLELGQTTLAADYALLAIWRREFLGHLTRMFEAAELFIAPVASIEPPTLEEIGAMANAPWPSTEPLLAHTIPFNLAGVPSLTLPMRTGSSGVPLGFQMIGPNLGESTLLAAGAAFERITGFSTSHPGI